MKKILCLLLSILLTVSISACRKKQDKPVEPINYYYRTRQLQYGTSQDVISAEVRDQFGHSEDYVYLINDYLLGPKTETCISPFPAGTNLIQLELVKNKAIVILSAHITLLTGAELTIACTCLARTVQEMTGMKSVQISTERDLLDGEIAVIIYEDDFVLEDDYIPGENTD